MVGNLHRHLLERLACLVLLAECHQGTDQPTPGVAILWFLLQQLAEQFAGVLSIAALERRPGIGEQIGGGHRTAGQLQQAFDKALHIGFGQRALEYVSDLALPECGDRRDRLHRKAELRELLHERAVLVDVDLHHLHAATGGTDHLFQRRRELLAGTAPGRPEIDEDRKVARCLHDLLHEGLLVAIHDDGAALAARRGWVLTDNQLVHDLLTFDFVGA